jgi:hypothetical protein
MNKQDFWRLSVAFWPRAAEAGLQPCVAAGYGEEGPQFYRPYDIDFANRPSQEDFLAVVQQTPWMHAWERALLPVIAKNDWPVVGPYHKAAHVELSAGGKVVGQLRVHRQTLYLNGGNHAAA